MTFAVNRPSPHLSFHSPPPGEYEFSCTTSPNHHFSLFRPQKKQPTPDLDIKAFNAAVLKAMEVIHSETASPALPGFGRTPVVRQLRVTDSPFPVNNVDEDNRVDEAAERFISRFYNDLRRQKRISGGETVATEKKRKNLGYLTIFVDTNPSDDEDTVVPCQSPSPFQLSCPTVYHSIAHSIKYRWCSALPIRLNTGGANGGDRSGGAGNDVGEEGGGEPVIVVVAVEIRCR
ncbi:hypothetical protein L1987_67069 [Smallanthus sonchifolius]|uniref:Uncharacterized protein n=1 Tax=Smallanthus sonchifolius TaxID=185202 RepID=A0ACB9BZB9_9ASTR|nr:hypothetical protein L1987_67069 [Smallanthus sonchifolius]